jgi:hypothetical protein
VCLLRLGPLSQITIVASLVIVVLALTVRIYLDRRERYDRRR